MNADFGDTWDYATANEVRALPKVHRVAWLTSVVSQVREGYAGDDLLAPVIDSSLEFCWEWVARRAFDPHEIEAMLEKIEQVADALPTDNIVGQSILPVYHMVNEIRTGVGTDAAAAINFLGHLYTQVVCFRTGIPFSQFPSESLDNMDNVANDFSYRTFIVATSRIDSLPNSTWLADVILHWTE